MNIEGSFKGVAGQVSTTINEQAAEMVAQYDRNGDGKLSAGERTRTTYSSYLDESTTTSIERLAVLADKMGTADGVTEAWEIADAMRLFDTGDTYDNWIAALLGRPDTSAHDGRLSGSERTSFEDTIGPTVEKWRYPVLDH